MLAIKKKKWFKVLAVVLVATLFVGLHTFVSSAEDIEAQNPVLELANIDSDAETTITGYPWYQCDGTLEQGDGKYVLTTNSYVPWTLNDDISFAYNVFNVSDARTDTLSYEVTVDSFVTEGGAAQVGLMFRAGLESNAAEIYVHYRPGEGFLAVYRSVTGRTTQVRYTGVEEATFPLQFKIEKTGTSAKLYFKDVTMKNYRTFAVEQFAFSAPGPLYAGPAACAQAPDDTVYATATFSNIKITGKGSYVPSEDGSGGTTAPEETLPEADADILPTDKNIILYETFTDGDVTDGEMAIGKYEWTGVTNKNIVTENSNRHLSRDFTDIDHWYVGDESWTDYQVSADLQFTSANEMDYNVTDVAFRMIARCTRNVFYGVSGYAAVLRNTSKGPVLELYKQYNVAEDASTNGVLMQTVTMDNFYGDGLWHNLSMVVFDNIIKVYWDGECKIDFADDGNTYGLKNMSYDVCAQGAIAFSSNEAVVNIDNLTVKTMEDTLNGSFDNFIGDMWNEKIPEYILEAIEDGVRYNY